jgi:rfaE bifunctional protein kinase chain/domain
MINAKKYISKFNGKNIIVLGDVMLDKYILGRVDRISPEAPVPVVKVSKENYVPGGAANAANNIVTMGGNAFLFGIVGNDLAKDIFLDEAKIRSINTENILIDAKKPTIQKIRVLGQSQQLIRIDYEDQEYIDKKMHLEIIDKIKKLENVGAIIISDYAKGIVTKELMKELEKYSKEKEILLVVDPKPRHKSFYNGVSLITPNKKEAEEMTGIRLVTSEDVEKAGKRLMEELDCDVIITTGESGMSIFEKKKKPVHIPTLAKEVYDVSGAGDTVIATLSLALSSGASLQEAAILANHAAGIKVGKLGTAPVSLEELKESLNNHE